MIGKITKKSAKNGRVNFNSSKSLLNFELRVCTQKRWHMVRIEKKGDIERRKFRSRLDSNPDCFSNRTHIAVVINHYAKRNLLEQLWILLQKSRIDRNKQSIGQLNQLQRRITAPAHQQDNRTDSQLTFETPWGLKYMNTNQTLNIEYVDMCCQKHAPCLACEIFSALLWLIQEEPFLMSLKISETCLKKDARQTSIIFPLDVNILQ